MQKRVKELTEQVKKLHIENASLTAEVEIYRAEAAASGPLNGNAREETKAVDDSDIRNVFIRSGNGIYPKNNELTLKNMHGISNPLCCALSSDDTVLATGGADATLRLVKWGTAWATDNEKRNEKASQQVVDSATILHCHAPVIAVAFSSVLKQIVACGSMDGSLLLVDSSTGHCTPLPAKWNHQKYVRAIAWSPEQPILATASADGTVHVYRVEKPNALSENQDLVISQLTSLHLSGAVEALCFFKNELVAYARDTPYLSYFDVDNNFELRQINLNKTSKSAVTGGFDEHVSFCIMHLVVSPCGKYLAAATDTSRNIILDAATGKQIRNLYGHKNDGFSQPKVAFSKSGQYLLGNTQEDASICVWCISSSNLLERLPGHGQPLRDMSAGNSMDCLVTTSFDKQTKLWFAPPE